MKTRLKCRYFSNTIARTHGSVRPPRVARLLLDIRSSSLPRDGFRERWPLDHLSFWGPTQVWPIWPFVWKAWKCAPSNIYLLRFRLWFYICLRSSTEIKAFPAFF